MTRLVVAVLVCALVSSCGFQFNLGSGVFLTKDGDGVAAAKRTVTENVQVALEVTEDPVFQEGFTATAGAGKLGTYGGNNYAAGIRQKFPVDNSYCTEEKIREYATRAHAKGWRTVIRPMGAEGMTAENMLVATQGKYNYFFITTSFNVPDVMVRKTYDPNRKETTSPGKTQCYVQISSQLMCVSPRGEICKRELVRNDRMSEAEYLWPADQ